MKEKRPSKFKVTALNGKDFRCMGSGEMTVESETHDTSHFGGRSSIEGDQEYLGWFTLADIKDMPGLSKATEGFTRPIRTSGEIDVRVIVTNFNDGRTLDLKSTGVASFGESL